MKKLMPDQIKLLPRWYFGGVAAAATVCITHPLDLLKVHLQTDREKSRSFFRLGKEIVKNQGLLALYSGLTAAVLRQLTYSTTRFALYDLAKKHINMNRFRTKVSVAAVAGAIGGWTGVPSDIVNVRMQNDVKLPQGNRRNYKNVVDGMIRVYREEGIKQLFRGSTMVSLRAVMVTVGQLSVYDQVKYLFLISGFFTDNLMTHFNCSFLAGFAATLLSQPFDVVKTRQMNAKPGQFKGIWDCVFFTSKEGPFAFFKGIVPSSFRIVPNTIIVFILYEHLIKYFGYVPQKSKLQIRKSMF